MITRPVTSEPRLRSRIRARLTIDLDDGAIADTERGLAPYSHSGGVSKVAKRRDAKLEAARRVANDLLASRRKARLHLDHRRFRAPLLTELSRIHLREARDRREIYRVTLDETEKYCEEVAAGLPELGGLRSLGPFLQKFSVSPSEQLRGPSHSAVRKSGGEFLKLQAVGEYARLKALAAISLSDRRARIAAERYAAAFLSMLRGERKSLRLSRGYEDALSERALSDCLDRAVLGVCLAASDVLDEFAVIGFQMPDRPEEPGGDELLELALR